MSKARAQSQKRRAQRVMFGLQSDNNSTKFPGKRLQIICIKPKKKRGRKSVKQIQSEKQFARTNLCLFKTKHVLHKIKS